MAISFRFSSNVAEWKKSIREKQKPVAEAGVAALRDVAATSVQEGRQDIGAAGPGFRRAEWQSGLYYRTKGATEGAEGGLSLNAKATIRHKYGIAGVFEYGANLRAKSGKLMWIPAQHKGSTASRFDVSIFQKKDGMERSPYLTSATINGTPVMFDKRDKSRDRKPVFFGVEEVHIPKKFHVTEITEENFKNFGVFFYLHFKDDT